MILTVSTLVVALSLFGTTLVDAPDRVYEAVVTGMTCKGCGREVKDLLAKLDGVKTIEADTKTGKVTITMNGEAKLERAAIDKALKGSKFAVSSMDEKKAPESKPKG